MVLETLRPDSIEHAIDNAHAWLRVIGARLGYDESAAQCALRVVLHVLRDRLPLPEAVALGAQLPLVIRGLYYEGWSPQATPARARHVEEFLGVIERGMAELHVKVDPQHAAVVVFAQLCAHVAPTHVQRVLPALPPGLRLLLGAVGSSDQARGCVRLQAAWS
jgi:uncharacterized protein (DUF2267 family)